MKNEKEQMTGEVFLKDGNQDFNKNGYVGQSYKVLRVYIYIRVCIYTYYNQYVGFTRVQEKLFPLISPWKTL